MSDERLFIAAAVFAVVAVVTMWVLTEHHDEAAQLLKIGTGKVRTWLD